VEGADSFFIEGGKIAFQSIHYGLLSDATSCSWRLLEAGEG
jgi:hypothetical protein